MSRLLPFFSVATLALAPACVLSADPPKPILDPATTLAITSAYAAGPGSIAEAIETANQTPGVRQIVSRLAPGTIVHVFRELPQLAARGVVFDAAEMTLHGGSCVRNDGRKGCDGLVVTGAEITVRRLRATGFTFDGIAVRGADARRVRIENCHCYENSDDGIGISAGASDVVVENCRLERNGYRTKGKGILVFEYATAELRGNTIRYNRDGVTVSRRARATLIGNSITDNYDKGLGLSGADAGGRDNVIARNGRVGPDGPPGPNADGVRLTIDSRLELENSRIVDNGDIGLVAIGTSSAVLVDSRIAGNGGAGVHVRERAIVELRDIVLEDNGRGDLRIEGDARIIRSGER